MLGRAGWGINWYINGTLIPELVVERGKTYTFMVEGGDNPSDSSNYHPFYITDSIDGGRLRNDQEMQNVIACNIMLKCVCVCVCVCVCGCVCVCVCVCVVVWLCPSKSYCNTISMQACHVICIPLLEVSLFSERKILPSIDYLVSLYRVRQCLLALMKMEMKLQVLNTCDNHIMNSCTCLHTSCFVL